MDQLVYVSKKELKKINEFERMLKNSPYLKNYLLSIENAYKAKEVVLEEQNKALTAKVEKLENLIKEISDKVALRDQNGRDLLREYLFGTAENGGDKDAEEA